MFTNIEGDIDDVLKVIRDATMKLAGGVTAPTW